MILVRFESGELSPQAHLFLSRNNIEILEKDGVYQFGVFKLESRRALINIIEFSAVKELEAPYKE